jgi:hypothetical protein
MTPSHRIDYSEGFIDFFAAKMGGPRKAGHDDFFGLSLTGQQCDKRENDS